MLSTRRHFNTAAGLWLHCQPFVRAAPGIGFRGARGKRFRSSGLGWAWELRDRSRHDRAILSAPDAIRRSKRVLAWVAADVREGAVAVAPLPPKLAGGFRTFGRR